MNKADLIIKNTSTLEQQSVDICVTDGKIAAIMPTSCQNKAKEYLTPPNGSLCLPGFINAHCHVPMTLLRGYADGLPLEQWLNEKIFPIEDKMQAADFYYGAMLGIMEMLSSGTTVFADMYFGCEEIVKAVTESGIKANIARACMCVAQEDVRQDKRLEEALNLYKNFHNTANGRVRIDIAIHAIYTSTPKYIAQVIEQIDALDVALHIHLSETETENTNCLKKYNHTPTEVFAQAQAFRKPTYAAHCVHLTENDIEILAQNDVTVVHNPSSNLKLGSGIADIPKLQSKGINVALGTDGASSNNNLNILEEAHIASLLHNRDNPNALSAQQVLEMLTNNGGRALRRASGIVTGNPADIVIIDTDKPHHLPHHAPLPNLVYSSQSSDVYATIVDGKILYKNREYLTIDYEKVKYNIMKRKEVLFK